MQNISNLRIVKTKHKSPYLKSYFCIVVETNYGVIYSDEGPWDDFALEVFIKGIKLCQPFTAIEIIDKTKPEEETNEVKPFKNDDDDIPF